MLFSRDFVFILCDGCWVYWIYGLMSFIDFGQLNAGWRVTVPGPDPAPRRHHRSLITPLCYHAGQGAWGTTRAHLNPTCSLGPSRSELSLGKWSLDVLLDAGTRIKGHRWSPLTVRCASLLAGARASHGSSFLHPEHWCWEPGADLLLPGHRGPPPPRHLLFSPSLWAKFKNSPRSRGPALSSLPFLSAARWGLNDTVSGKISAQTYFL